MIDSKSAHWTPPQASVRGVGVAIDKAVVVYDVAEVQGGLGRYSRYIQWAL